MLSCSIWFSALSFWMGGGPESRCVGRVYGADGVDFRVYGADGALHPSKNSVQKTICCNLTSNAPDDGRMYRNMGTIRTVNTTYAAALKTTTHPKTRCRKPYAAT